MIEASQRSLYLREVYKALEFFVSPELTSARAIDAAACAGRILAHLIVAQEHGADLEAGFAEGIANQLPEPGSAFPRSVQLAQQLVASGAVRHEDENAIFRDMIEAERNYIERLSAFRDEILNVERGAVEEETAPSVTAAQIQQYLRCRLSEFPKASVENLVLLPGGRSKETLLFQLFDAGPLSGTVIMRKDLPASLNPGHVSDECKILELAEEAGVPVPRPLLVEPDPSILNGTFLLLSYVSGERKGEIFPDVSFPVSGRREIGLHLAEIVARIHAIPTSRLRSEASPAEELRERLLQRIDISYRRFHDVADGEPSVLFEIAHRWLLENIDAALEGPIVIRHGDLGLHNMLIEGHTITALLDWELSTIGPASADLGSLRHTVRALMPWEDFVATYIANGGQPAACEDRAVRFYSIVGKLQGMANTQLGGAMFRNGHRRSIVTANSAADFRYRLGRLLATDLGEIWTQPSKA